MKTFTKNPLKITVYTITGFPYGMAAENFVRQMVLGINENIIDINVVLIQGENSINRAKNDTNIYTSNILFKNKPSNPFLIILEILFIPIIIPYSLLKQKIKFNSGVIYNTPQMLDHL